MGSTARFMLAGGGLKAAGQILGGYSQRAGLDASANELTQEAGQSVAAGIQGAIADRRRATGGEVRARALTSKREIEPAPAKMRPHRKAVERRSTPHPSRQDKRKPRRQTCPA